MENGQKSAEWEAQVFNRSRTREEYVKLVATLIWKLRDYNKKVCFNFGPGHIQSCKMDCKNCDYCEIANCDCDKIAISQTTQFVFLSDHRKVTDKGHFEYEC